MTVLRLAGCGAMLALVVWSAGPIVASEATPNRCAGKVVDLTDARTAEAIEAALADSPETLGVVTSSASMRVSRATACLRDRSGTELVVTTECTLTCNGASCTGSGCEASSTGCSSFTCSGSGCSGSCTKKSTYAPPATPRE
jgi:hypothetical protein